MHACPAESTKRSRCCQLVSAGLTRKKRLNSVYASGASAIAVPGWPAFARCTESIASPRTVSIDSLRSSLSSITGDPSGDRVALAFAAMAEEFCDVGRDITLCYETFGERSTPTALLIMGLATQMIAWHDDFCRELASRELYVVRVDNRDIRRSTHLSGPPPT